MRAYVVSRLAQTALVVFLSLTAVFGLVRLSGDPVLLFMPTDIQAKDVDEFRQRLGFNDPLALQYARFLGGAVRGDFGQSLRYKQDALGLVLDRLPATVLAAFFAARIARLTRSTVLEAIGEDYVLTARAKGLAASRVIGKHALRNAAIPVLTLAGLEIGQLLGGAVITETIFAWPGLGRLTVQALLNRDFPVVLAAVFVISATYTVINLLVDILYGWLDPRVRLRA